jgi:hypothetical protein
MSSSKLARKPEPKKEQPVDNQTEEGATHKPMGIPQELTLEDRVARLEAEIVVMQKNCRRSHGPR